MRKTFLCFLMILVMSWSSFKAQNGGSDYIIMLDNGHFSDEEFIHMRRGALKFIEKLVACNHTNRIAVVHYGTGIYNHDTGVYKPTIYIESDFTGEFDIMQNIERRLDFGDRFNESLGLIDDALNGLPNANIVSPQKTLENHNPLKIVVFTNSYRSYDVEDSYLVNYNNIAMNAPAAFENAVKFKTERQAQFTFIHTNTKNDGIQAAASISSPGGAYFGPLESNIADPDNGNWPRLYFNRPDGFSMAPSDYDYWRNVAEYVCDFSTWGTIKFKFEPNYCSLYPGAVAGDFSLPVGAVFDKLWLHMINIQTGQRYEVPINPQVTGNQFSFLVQSSDFNDAINAGATGQCKLQLVLHYKYQGSDMKAFSWNEYPYFDYDIDLDCYLLLARSSEKTLFRLTPNPTDGLFKAILNKEIKSGTLEVRDLVGNTVYKKALRGEKEIEVDLGSRKEGVYMVNVTTDKNETSSEKIIKK